VPGSENANELGDRNPAMFRVRILFAELTAILLFASPALAAADPEELYRRGLRLFAEHKPEAAIDAYHQSLALRPSSAAVWKALGVAYASRGDYAHSEGPFHRACLLNAGEPDACLYFGRTLYLLDRFDESLDVLREAGKKDPKNAQIARIQALCLEALGKTAEAAVAFQESMRLERDSPPNEDPAIDYAVFLFRQGSAEEALAPLKAALQRHPDAARAHLELGCVLLALDRAKEAATSLEQAVKLDPVLPRSHLLLGKAYLRVGKTTEAQKELEQANRGGR
jgi:tetratricopeptide (TPR) repeat protein